ncbi:hypothetical protein QOT17_016734 [Balamuthia mandrillaris]
MSLFRGAEHNVTHTQRHGIKEVASLGGVGCCRRPGCRPADDVSDHCVLHRHPWLCRGHRPLNPYEVNLFRTFVEEGGVLVWIANAYSLNSSFVWGWESPVSDKDFEKTEEAAEGPFAEGGPATLTRLDNMEAVSNWEGDGVVCHYADGKDCAVLSVSFGEGFVVYLGANFTSNEGEMIFPRGEERDLVTEDWEEVLALAVLKFVAGEEEESASQASESSESESSAAVQPLPALSLFA